ncbi:MAG: flagellar basal body rod protein FlgC [Candidatus Margulisbacteria bacterium]|nr:flagellar basal body rod protein FlgC [Candidatus Margulisiibacteriota bacterium]
MSFFQSAAVISSGMSVHREIMDIIAENLANINTLETETGEPYQRKIPIVSSKQTNNYSFSNVLGKKMYNEVQISSIKKDDSPPLMYYDPTHPLADENGYIKKPNISQTMEMVRMMDAVRAYEANVAVFNTSKSMAQRALQIGS